MRACKLFQAMERRRVCHATTRTTHLWTLARPQSNARYASNSPLRSNSPLVLLLDALL